jgi:tetratricopeptide (TPR) repeat protein
LAGFTFVGREAEVSMFRRLLERPRGEVLAVAGAEGSGKTHLLRRFRAEAERQGRHVVQLTDLAPLPDADLRCYAILTALAAGQQKEPGKEGEAPPAVQFTADPHEFSERLMTHDRRPPCDKLLSVFAAASAHLPADSRLVLLLDLGRVEGEDAFPLELFARRLPEKVKLVVAARQPPPELAALDNASGIPNLPALAKAEVAHLLEFHRPRSGADSALVAATLQKFHGDPMLSDIAAKLIAPAADPAAGLAALADDPKGLCGELLGRLSDEQRQLAACIARVPLGVDIASLRALSGLPDAELRRLLRTDEIRNLVIIQRAARGPEANLFHEIVTDQFLAEEGPDAAAFHKRAAAFFLDLALGNSTHVEALAAHAHHVRLSGDRRQFIEDFPKTYKAKHTLRLFRHLAAEYRLLLQCCDELGEDSINRPVCLANLGRVYHQLGQHDDALRCHREALEIHQSQDDTCGTAEQLANIASVLQDLGRLDEALDHLRRAATLDEAAGNKAALAADLNNVGILCQRLERYDDAFQHHQRALALHRENANDVGVANQLANLAAIHRKRGDLDAARNAYQEAWRLDNRNQSNLAEIADLCNLGLIFQDLGDMAKAISCFQQAIGLDRTVADREAEAGHMRRLAAMHQKLGQHEDARQLLEQALAIDRSIGDSKGEVAGLIALAGARRASGGEVQAREFLERAATLAAKLGDAALETEARDALAELDRAPAETPPGEEHPPRRHAQPHLQQQPADRGSWDWGDLRLVDEEAPEVGPSTASPAAGLADTDLVATLRRERDAALHRAAELEAELNRYKQIVKNLKSIVGEASPSE